MRRACVSWIALLAGCPGGEAPATQARKDDASAVHVRAGSGDGQPPTAPVAVDAASEPAVVKPKEQPKAASATTLAVAADDVTRLAESNYKVDPTSGAPTEIDDRVFERTAATWTSPDGSVDRVRVASAVVSLAKLELAPNATLPDAAAASDTALAELGLFRTSGTMRGAGGETKLATNDGRGVHIVWGQAVDGRRHAHVHWSIAKTSAPPKRGLFTIAESAFPTVRVEQRPHGLSLTAGADVLAQMATMGRAMDEYRVMKRGRCPTALADLVDAELLDTPTTDPWGKEIRFQCPGPTGRHRFRSAGPDGTFGTEDDRVLEPSD